MNQQGFGGAVIPAMAGFFLFGKRAKVREIQTINPQQLPVVTINNTDGITGVAKYLLSAPVVSGVAKYLKKKEKHSISGVERYLLKQAIAERTAIPPSGVAKYLMKAAKQPVARPKSGVEKYLFKQERNQPNLAALTGVARYQAEQDLLTKKQAALTLVQKYREAEAAAKIAAREVAEADYEANRLTELQNQETYVMEASPKTGIGRYIQDQANLLKKKPKVTGVARYLAQKIVLDSQKPIVNLSKVDKYLRSQSLSELKRPKQTGVSKYISKQKLEAPTLNSQAKIIVKSSGVSRYLTAQLEVEKTKPVISSVAKYLEKQAESEKLKAIAQLSLPDYSNGSEASLEGEFIPATAEVIATGVSRYIEKQYTTLSAVGAEVSNGRLTGVARYLNNQNEPVKQLSSSQPVTGVDRYLVKKAS